MRRAARRIAIVLVAGLLLAAPVGAQTGVTIRVLRTAPVVDTPRGDGLVVGSVSAGTALEVLESQSAWFRIDPPKDSESKWVRGWIHRNFVEVVSGALAPAPTARAQQQAATRSGEMMFRGVVFAGLTLFSASDSFETVLDSRFGPTYGVGGQVGFPNGAYIEVVASRFEKTGSRAAISGNQIFRLDVPHRVRITPIALNLGFRDRGTGAYIAIGGSWHIFEESTPSLDEASVSKGRGGYQILGGVEFPIGSWLSLGGEAEWVGVPGGIGGSGVSAVFEEKNLGGGTFRFKVLVGR
jgi:hypothetical protein